MGQVRAAPYNACRHFEDGATEAVGHWEGVAREWEAAHPQPLWRAFKDRLHAEWLWRHLPPGQVTRALKTDLFDEAYGGGLASLLAARAEHVVGVDVSAAVVRVAQARHPGLRGVRADVRRLPFLSGHFDLVVSNSTLDHFASLDDVRLSLIELRRVLHGDGRLLLTLDNAANPFVALRNALPYRLLNRLGLVPYFVGATCGAGRLRGLLQQTGFEVVEEGTLLHNPRVLAVKASLLLQRHATPQAQRRFLRRLMAFERAAGWPTRSLTGHFITVVARPKPR